MISMGQSDTIFFWGHTSKDGKIGKQCLSQWWPCAFRALGKQYSSAEQYMMAEKARLFGDYEAEKLILAETDPKKIKELGRKVKGFERSKWDDAKFITVVHGNLFKFRQNGRLSEYLLSTGDSELVEASPYDPIWGIGMRQDDPDIGDRSRWGQNLLGLALMTVRDILRKDAYPSGQEAYE